MADGRVPHAIEGRQQIKYPVYTAHRALMYRLYLASTVHYSLQIALSLSAKSPFIQPGRKTSLGLGFSALCGHCRPGPVHCVWLLSISSVIPRYPCFCSKKLVQEKLAYRNFSGPGSSTQESMSKFLVPDLSMCHGY